MKSLFRLTAQKTVQGDNVGRAKVGRSDEIALFLLGSLMRSLTKVNAPDHLYT